MTPDARLKLKNLLLKHESYQQFPYTDTLGQLTVAIGRNLVHRGVSLSEAMIMLEDDIDYYYNRLQTYLKFFSNLSENRQLALIDMCFNIGVQGLLNFTQMNLALEAGDYVRAAQEMLDSKWAQQVPQRVSVLAEIIRTGEL